jgi:hypothetical protein
MRGQIPGMLRRAPCREVRGRAHNHLSLFARYRDSDHVRRDRLSEPNPGIESGRDEVRITIVDLDIELDRCVRRKELCEQRRR